MRNSRTERNGICVLTQHGTNREQKTIYGIKFRVDDDDDDDDANLFFATTVVPHTT